jgi:mono/diheme cytochrome c family protein
MNPISLLYTTGGWDTGQEEGNPFFSLYISESNKGKIWRVMYKGDKNKFGENELAEMEKRKSRSYIKTPDETGDNLNVGDELEGSILYKSYCASCHQGNGKGDNNRFPSIAASEFVTGDKNRLINILVNGFGGSNQSKWKNIQRNYASAWRNIR